MPLRRREEDSDFVRRSRATSSDAFKFRTGGKHSGRSQFCLFAGAEGRRSLVDLLGGGVSEPLLPSKLATRVFETRLEEGHPGHLDPSL